jgi:hypothetical protein
MALGRSSVYFAKRVEASLALLTVFPNFASQFFRQFNSPPPFVHSYTFFSSPSIHLAHLKTFKSSFKQALGGTCSAPHDWFSFQSRFASPQARFLLSMAHPSRTIRSQLSNFLALGVPKVSLTSPRPLSTLRHKQSTLVDSFGQFHTYFTLKNHIT